MCNPRRIFRHRYHSEVGESMDKSVDVDVFNPETNEYDKRHIKMYYFEKWGSFQIVLNDDAVERLGSGKKLVDNGKLYNAPAISTEENFDTGFTFYSPPEPDVENFGETTYVENPEFLTDINKFFKTKFVMSDFDGR